MKTITKVIASPRGIFRSDKKLIAGLQIIATNRESKKGTTIGDAVLIPASEITMAEKYRAIRAEADIFVI
ncbi:hypothetical protein GCM10007916_20360 [Psychromonas marina]|uniref:Uncharacterized protein n=1 Tax=Psychromonas marina TaxID=88364 RepID=A0ABQ6E151_9GAMM|nr:hypothetical protein GCM10007916_20360 [Psychromonas marina]